MISYRQQREARRRLKFSAMGKKSQLVQRERRMATVDMRQMEEIEIANLPRYAGDALGCLQWHDFRSGRVRRWVVRIGERRDQITVESPGQKPTSSHGWTWFLTQLRQHIV